MTIYDNLKPVASSLIAKFKSPKGQASYKRKVKTDDGVGGKEFTWSTIGSFDAVVIPASATEKEEAQRLSTQISHKFLVDPDDAPDITSKDAIDFDGREFNVKYPKDVAEGDVLLSIMCMEGVAQ